MNYTPSGLMTSFTTPLGHTSTFTYTHQGRLTRDDDAEDGSLELSRTGVNHEYTVSVTTGLSLTTNYQVVTDNLGNQTQTDTLPSGEVSVKGMGANGAQSLLASDGTRTNSTLGPDPLLGMISPLTKNTTVTTPGGLTASISSQRTATLAQAADPFSLIALNEIVTVNGHSYTSSYNAANHTFTDTSPSGRQQTTIIDDLGRPVIAQTAGLVPLTYTYDDRGRIATATQGSGDDARIATFAYNSDGYLASVTDPLNRTVSFYRHRLRQLIQTTGDLDLAVRHGVPRSTARGWLKPLLAIPSWIDYGFRSSTLATLFRHPRRLGQSATAGGDRYLRTENQVLKEKLGKKRILLTDDQRRRLAVKGKILGRKRLEEVGTLFTPGYDLAMASDAGGQEVGLQRADGRPSADHEFARVIVDLILRFAKENPTWGYDRIQGALANRRPPHLRPNRRATYSRNTVSNRSVTGNDRPRGRPSSSRTGMSWLRSTSRPSKSGPRAAWSRTTCCSSWKLPLAESIWPLARRVLGDDFMKQIARNLTDPFDGFLKDKKYVLMDRDSNFSSAFRATLKNAGVKSVRLPAQEPQSEFTSGEISLEHQIRVSFANDLLRRKHAPERCAAVPRALPRRAEPSIVEQPTD